MKMTTQKQAEEFVSYHATMASREAVVQENEYYEFNNKDVTVNTEHGSDAVGPFVTLTIVVRYEE